MIEFILRQKLIQIYWLGFTGAIFDFRINKIQSGITITLNLLWMHISINILPKIRARANRKRK